MADDREERGLGDGETATEAETVGGGGRVGALDSGSGWMSARNEEVLESPTGLRYPGTR